MLVSRPRISHPLAGWLVSIEADRRTDQSCHVDPALNLTSAFLDETHKLQILERVQSNFSIEPGFL